MNYSQEHIIYMPKGRHYQKQEKIVLTTDEVKALQLCCLEEKCMEEGGKIMNISASTFYRLKKRAQKKVMHALCNQAALILPQISQ